MLTRQSLVLGANVQAVAIGFWLNREAQGQATLEVLLVESSLAGETNRSPGWRRFVPEWWPLG